MATRKDYEGLAQVIFLSGAYEEELDGKKMHDYIATRIGRYFKSENPKFDLGLWLDNCGVQRS